MGGRAQSTLGAHRRRRGSTLSHGYSGTPLPRKLGIGEGATYAADGDPGHLDDLLSPLPAGVRRVETAGHADVVLFFTTSRSHLERELGRLGNAVFPDRQLWVVWPKRASKLPTDITEDVVRELALPLGLVDTKVAAIDGTWSGLRLVWRRERR